MPTIIAIRSLAEDLLPLTLPPATMEFITQMKLMWHQIKTFIWKGLEAIRCSCKIPSPNSTLGDEGSMVSPKVNTQCPGCSGMS